MGTLPPFKKWIIQMGVGMKIPWDQGKFIEGLAKTFFPPFTRWKYSLGNLNGRADFNEKWHVDSLGLEKVQRGVGYAFPLSLFMRWHFSNGILTGWSDLKENWSADSLKKGKICGYYGWLGPPSPYFVKHEHSNENLIGWTNLAENWYVGSLEIGKVNKGLVNPPPSLPQ